MTHTLRVKQLRGSSIFKLILIGHVIGLTLLCGVFSVPAVFGVEILSWNGEYITGPLALVMGPSGSSLAAEKEINPGRWAKNLPSDTRFTVLTEFNNEAVRDNNTRLVWEVSPTGGYFDWARAISHCTTRVVGGRKGWSLPMREQLASLVDTNSVLCIGGGLCLPDGHPFQNVQSASYWSATTTAGSPTFAWVVNFFFGGVLVMNLDGKGHAWCVR
jgi:hypothetical protein